MIYDWRPRGNDPGFGKLFNLDTGEEIKERVFYIDTNCPYSYEYRYYKVDSKGVSTTDWHGDPVVVVVKGVKVKFVPMQP